MKDNMPSDEKVKLARIVVMRRELTYLASAVSAMSLVESEECPTMAVDQYWRCYYNPKLVQEWDVETVGGVLAHEVSHLIRKHWKRVMPEHQIWNVATDCEINDDVTKGTSLKLPPDGCFPKNFKLPENLTGEEYYAKLIEKTKIINVPQPSFGGSCADGEKRPWELPGDSTEQPGMSDEEGNLIIMKVANDVKKCGNAPAGLQRWADSVLEPQVNWRNQIRNIISRCINVIRGQMFRSYKVFSRRQHPDFVMPGMVSPIPRIKLIIDTSGSMDNVLLGMCLAEVQGVLKVLPGSHIQVITGDTTTSSKQTVHNVRQVKMKGGGGTDMGAIVEQNTDDTDIIIVLTDGYTPWCKPVKPKVIACVFSDEKTPAWITRINVRP